MFRCQRDSFLNKLETTVVSCEEVQDVKGAVKKLGLDPEDVVPGQKLYKVILHETVFFPEGGGQPDDRGTIAGSKVVRVIREGNLAIHYLVSENVEVQENLENNSNSLPFVTEQKVSIEIDWKRRFDHMQQHSGQHLITAIADKLFGYSTTSWYLGKEDSFIELDTLKVTDAQRIAIEDTVNEKIRDSVALNVDVVELDDPKLKTARGRNLPADVTGNIRIVTMGDIESNVCCGTHVTNLSQLQVIKLLQCEVIGKKSKTHLYFVAGNRVIKRFQEMYQREGDLMKTLKTNPGDLPSACEKMNASCRGYRKNLLTLNKELALIEAKAFVEQMSTSSKLCHFQRDNIEPEYATAFLREIGSQKGKVVFLSFKYEVNSANIYLLRGDDSIDENLFKEITEQISTLLSGKGSLRGNQYQAKVSKPNAINKAIEYLENKINAQVEP